MKPCERPRTRWPRRQPTAAPGSDRGAGGRRHAAAAPGGDDPATGGAEGEPEPMEIPAVETPTVLEGTGKNMTVEDFGEL